MDLPINLPIDSAPVRLPDEARIREVKTREAAREVADEFESMFIAQMLQPLFESINTDAPFGGGAAERAFRPLLVNEYAAELSKSGGLGLSDQIMSEILRMQGLEG